MSLIKASCNFFDFDLVIGPSWTLNASLLTWKLLGHELGLGFTSITLTPLSSKEVYDDQCKMEKERSEAKNNKKESENPKGEIQPKEKTKGKGSFLAK